METLRVRVTISDPWDLGESIEWKTLLGELVKIDIDARGGRALIKFDQSIPYQGASYQFAVVAPRHEGSSLTTVRDGGIVFCAFTGVSEEPANSDNSLSTDFWRGGLAFIGDLFAD